MLDSSVVDLVGLHNTNAHKIASGHVSSSPRAVIQFLLYTCISNMNNEMSGNESTCQLFVYCYESGVHNYCFKILQTQLCIDY